MNPFIQNKYISYSINCFDLRQQDFYSSSDKHLLQQTKTAELQSSRTLQPGCHNKNVLDPWLCVPVFRQVCPIPFAPAGNYQPMLST
jgi:hypothetical protein